MTFKSDIDIDFGNRELILQHINYVAAAIRKVNLIKKHNTGVYVTEIPYDSINDIANIDYVEAENRGYIKLDLLNVHVYDKVTDEKHLTELMQNPDWSMLKDYNRMKSLIHLQNHYHTIKKMPEPIDSIPRLAMFLAIIRPGKKHLIGNTWAEIAKTVWDKAEDGYTFKKSHSIAYAHLVVVHMNLLNQVSR